MSRPVKVYTTATNVETGEVVNLAPGDTAPDWAKMGDHVYTDEDPNATPTEPVAGPSQSAVTKAQLDELEADLKAAKQPAQAPKKA